MSITFKAPCDGSSVDGLNVYYNGVSTSFSLRDAHGNDLAGLDGLFSAGTYVKAILNTVAGLAYLQNADTNTYLETSFASLTGKAIDRFCVEKITTSQTWTAPKSTGQLFKVFAVGGGGAGAGSSNDSNNNIGGGGGGGYVEIADLTISEGTEIAVVCGAGGSTSASNADGGNGGTTKFGDLLTAAGGKGGKLNSNGGYGGAGGAGGGGGCTTTNSKNYGSGGTGGTYGGGGGAHQISSGSCGGNGGTYGASTPCAGRACAGGGSEAGKGHRQGCCKLCRSGGSGDRSGGGSGEAPICLSAH